jgi:hypothetical protein
MLLHAKKIAHASHAFLQAVAIYAMCGILPSEGPNISRTGVFLQEMLIWVTSCSSCMCNSVQEQQQQQPPHQLSLMLQYKHLNSSRSSWASACSSTAMQQLKSSSHSRWRYQMYGKRSNNPLLLMQPLKCLHHQLQPQMLEQRRVQSVSSHHHLKKPSQHTQAPAAAGAQAALLSMA